MMIQAIAHAKIDAILNQGIPVFGNLFLIAKMAGGIFMMHECIGSLYDGVTCIVYAAAHIRFIEKIFVLFVKSTNFQKSLATEGAVCAQQVGDIQTERKIQVGGGDIPIACICPAVCRYIACLKFNAGMVVNEPSHRANAVVSIGFGQIRKPFRLWHGIIVDKGDNIAIRHGDSDIARYRQIKFWTMLYLYLSLQALQIFYGSVRRGASNDTNFKMGISQVFKAR
ncbi:hypothetical protein GXY_00509 [Novacetimonas hansenii ATCC 23769]|uniref:Uncharacterized protein n=1 Tax=Novacetimonas hansenii ATCC 23769 TaxID=714995 RepID=D5QAG7_NOVHA|nr:hypothetical protein GXY_00509 [Novacetimonas hansenii ATCC 23769]RFP06000.1 hypothetical protein BGC30_13315 [Novacetimonas hansenii]